MYKLANPAENLIEVKWFYLYFISEWIAGQCDIWIHWRRHRSWSIVSCMKNGWFGHIFQMVNFSSKILIFYIVCFIEYLKRINHNVGSADYQWQTLGSAFEDSHNFASCDVSCNILSCECTSSCITLIVLRSHIF